MANYTKGRDNNVRKSRSSWDDSFYVTAYRLAAAGQKDEAIAKGLGVKSETFRKWCDENPTLRKAVQDGRERANRLGVRAFMQHVADRVPDDLKDLWEMLSSEDDSLRERACSDVKAADMLHQQHVYVSAYIALNCNFHAACRATGIHQQTVMAWRAGRGAGGQFKRLTDLIRQAMGDFYEDALIDLVNAREPSAVIFASKTFNADRGYGTKVQVDVRGEIEHRPALTVKDLTPDEIKTLLEAHRRKNASGLLEHKDARAETVDAEFETKK